MSYHQCNNPLPWNNFFQHYMQQHAIMSYHFQKLHQNIPCNPGYSDCQYPAITNCPSEDILYSASSSLSCSSGSGSSYSSSSSESVEEHFEEEYVEYEEDDDEESEYELNVEAILAMRAAKEELKKEEASRSSSRSDSIVLVDSDREEFEFVELGSLKTLESKLARGVCGRNNYEEQEAQKAIMEFLYGDKSCTIGGLETVMTLNFERLVDDHQPSLWPVLPLLL